MDTKSARSPLQYLFGELSIRSDEWIVLSSEEKEQLKAMAAEEMAAKDARTKRQIADAQRIFEVTR